MKSRPDYMWLVLLGNLAKDKHLGQAESERSHLTRIWLVRIGYSQTGNRKEVTFKPIVWLVQLGKG